MKITQLLLVAGLLSGTALAVSGAPASKSWPPVRTAEEFARINPGEKIAYVCKECDSVTVATLDSKDAIMQLCKVGDMIECPACKQSYRIVRLGPPSKGRSISEIRYVNQEGKECMFIARVSE
ncbi:MAG: hypothetical protein H3C27_10050 [Opitutaceae bacterium]|nr:hypothetical protein [Opitutaceae bacterium]